MTNSFRGLRVLVLFHILANRASSSFAGEVPDGLLFAQSPKEPDCDPSKVPHVHLDWGNMNGHGPSFQAWRSTTNSVDIRFLLFRDGYTDGQPWGPRCPWPIKFICIVKTVAERPSVADFEQNGKGPGLGAKNCTWAQATSSSTNGMPQHCHVYLYNLEGSAYLDIQYHAWCMACLGPDCSESTESMIYPRKEMHVMKTSQDYEKVIASTQGSSSALLKADVALSSGSSISGYTMDDGCRCRIDRTITGYRRSPKDPIIRVANKGQLPPWKHGLELVLDDGLPFKTVGFHAHEEHWLGCTQVLVACFALIMYICWSLFGLQRYLFFLHETGLATLIGYAIGGFKMLVAQDFEYVEFTFETMSFVVLPIVIFAAGFNFKKKSLFKYCNYIVLYGFVGTLVVFFGFFEVFRQADSFPAGSFPSSKSGVEFVWDTKTCLILAAVLSCCDTVAPLTLIDPVSLPVLYAVVFGEAVINDVVGVLLNAEVIHWLEAPGVLSLFLNTASLLLGSLVFGLVFGLLISWLYAHCETLQQGVLQPVLLLMMMNYLCYAIVELLELSAIFAIFVSALVCSHYAAFSLSHTAHHFANEASELLAYLCESAMFVYFGYASATYLSNSVRFPICIRAVLYCTGAIVVLRPLVLTLLTNAMQAMMGCRKLAVPYSTIFVFELSGCIRGTISYALILKHMPSFEYRTEHQHILVSTVLLVVNFTTITFGFVLPICIKCLQKGKPKKARVSLQDYEAQEISEVEVTRAPSSATTNTCSRSSSAVDRGEDGQEPRVATDSTRKPGSQIGTTYRRTYMPFVNIHEKHLQHHPHSTWHIVGHKWKAFDNAYLVPSLCKKDFEDMHHHAHS